MKFAYLDFEFNGTTEAKLNLVSVSCVCTDGAVVTYERNFWLYEKKSTEALDFFTHLVKKGYIFVGYTEAEPRSLHALGLKNFPYVDLYLEYRCLLNHNHKLSYGVQYIDGKVLTTTPPPLNKKWNVGKIDDEGEEDEAHHKPQYSLAACTFKLLDVKIDTVEKNEVRDIIIRGDRAEIIANAVRIMDYNKTDIVYLPRILNAVYGRFKALSLLSPEQWLDHALRRGDYSRRTALMVSLGYPINTEKVKSFTVNASHILKDAAKSCVRDDFQPFKWDKKFLRYSVNEAEVRKWIEANPKPTWRKTPGKKLSLSKDAFGDWYDSSSEGFGGDFYRYLKTKQSLNGFLPGGGKKGKFTDYLGSDGRVRPHFGIYGSQSSRSQPKATGFIPLKAHWMRNFIEPKPGHALAGIDYASQEFLIAAIISQDHAMIDAYDSGDVYLAFAKDAGLIPKDGTKQSHPKERDAAKTTVLGMSYDMAAKALAHRLSESTGEEWTEAKAEGLIKLFFSTYSKYAAWKNEILKEYRDENYLRLPDGWYMWGDNPNFRSVSNFPVQGHGAVIMRRAVTLAQDAGLDVIFTLHDALYIEFDSTRPVAAIGALMATMQQAFYEVMERYGRVTKIRLEGEAWSPDYVNVVSPLPDVEFLSEYVDKKGKADLERYRKYLIPGEVVTVTDDPAIRKPKGQQGGKNGSGSSRKPRGVDVSKGVREEKVLQV